MGDLFDSEHTEINEYIYKLAKVLDEAPKGLSVEFAVHHIKNLEQVPSSIDWDVGEYENNIKFKDDEDDFYNSFKKTLPKTRNELRLFSDKHLLKKQKNELDFFKETN